MIDPQPLFCAGDWAVKEVSVLLAMAVALFELLTAFPELPLQWVSIMAQDANAHQKIRLTRSMP
jgi:hypothetical protein